MLEEILSLSVEKRIGQLFFIGLNGTEIGVNNRQLLQDVSPGGICLFGRNIRSPEQTRKLLDESREVLPIKPFLSLDQEGGLVDRLRRISTPMPAANNLKNTADAKFLGETTSEVLQMLGFNLNFAPVVDVVNQERKTFDNGLYSRTFGNSQEQVLEFADSYVGAVQKNGCFACLKHFPGLGASEIDSHENLPLVNVTRDELFSIDLFPYKNLFLKSQIEVVMMAHAAYPHIDLQETGSNGKLLPSSLSYNFVTRLLRRELGFEGLVLTDDLEMGAILKNHTVAEACKLAFLAGADMFSICSSEGAVREGYAAILKAVENGEISEARINESLERIANLKSLLPEATPLDTQRFQFLSQNIAELNKKVNYSYGG
jgi:beta-N-acetylhexosaminidase